jgi:enoyl-CoA hydratase/carnithine racemase
MNQYKTIKTRVDGGVLYADLNAPPLNLLGPELAGDLGTLLKEAEADRSVRVLVFSSLVPDFFIAHLDMAQLPAFRAALVEACGDPSYAAFVARISQSRLVTIAMVEGRARGAGSEFVLGCDMVFASRERAIFGQPEIGLGLMPGGGAAQHLPRLMGRGRALEVLLGGDDFNADLAERYGWVTRSLPDGELRRHVEELARRIASFSAEGVRTIKSRLGAALPSPGDMVIDEVLFGAGARHPDTQAAVKALFGRGLQQLGDTELNLGAALAK